MIDRGMGSAVASIKASATLKKKAKAKASPLNEAVSYKVDHYKLAREAWLSFVAKTGRATKLGRSRREI
jgi:hypothetical protein